MKRRLLLVAAVLQVVALAVFAAEFQFLVDGGKIQAQNNQAISSEVPAAVSSSWELVGNQLRPKVPLVTAGLWTASGNKLSPNPAGGSDTYWELVGNELRPKVP